MSENCSPRPVLECVSVELYASQHCVELLNKWELEADVVVVLLWHQIYYGLPRCINLVDTFLKLS